MIQKITQNNWNFWTVNLIMRAKIVIQSADFPVRRTGSYRHKKALYVIMLRYSDWIFAIYMNYATIYE